MTRQDLRVSGAGRARAEARVRDLARHGHDEKLGRSLASYRGWLSFPSTELDATDLDLAV